MRKFTNCLFDVAIYVALTCSALAAHFDIPAGNLKSALNIYMKQTGLTLMYAGDEITGAQTHGTKGDISADAALLQILNGTGFAVRRDASVIEIIRDSAKSSDEAQPLHSAAATIPTIAGSSLETVTVTSSKIGGDVQNIPISITAMSQEQLTATQTAGGPDLVKQVPNLTFTKTNFTGYSINIRGIGTQAISVATDPAVAVALNSIPFIRNHFFEQEFYDVSQVEVLRGPQGTLYGRNATAGVVNLVSARPTDQFEAMLSADIGNYQNRRVEGMINIPIVDDRFDMRIAGEWTKRSGYTFDETTGRDIDGRDLWSGRVSLGWKPFEKLQADFIWEHFAEDDDRLNSGKQLCKRDPGPTSLTDPTTGIAYSTSEQVFLGSTMQNQLSQGCLPTSLYSPSAFETPNGLSDQLVVAGALFGALNSLTDPYASALQSPNLRVIQSVLTPTYRIKADTLELNADYDVTPALTFSSQTGYGADLLRSTQDFNNFNTADGIFRDFSAQPGGIMCDPQLGCSSKVVGENMSLEHSWQLSQEFRLASNFKGPLNFSVGTNYLHYETEESFYVFYNVATAIALAQNLPAAPGTFPNLCFGGIPITHVYGTPGADVQPFGCTYVDPNPITKLNDEGHNYFLNRNPYTLNSYAGFGEVNYQVLPDVKLIGGLRWTDDQKHFLEIPSWIAIPGWGYPVVAVVDQQWGEMTGRAVANWTPKLDFTDQTLVYASYSRGYKAGGANPPPPVVTETITHPLTFNPEFVNAYELGSKNTLLDGAVTLNGDVFYYDYKGYQISEIVDRTAINLNFDATVKGAELEANWEPMPGLRFNFSGGYEDTRLANGDKAVDLIDRTAGNPNWVVYKPFLTATSNCVLPVYVVTAILRSPDSFDRGAEAELGCARAYGYNNQPPKDPLYAPPPGYPGFDPGDPNATNAGAGPAPNGGAGFDKPLGGKELPNAPPFTVSFGAQYTMPVTSDWAATLRGDYYWQDNSWARVFNDNPYDRLHGYTNVNLTLILNSQDGWQVMGYLKNVFNVTAITGDFLYSDDVGLTTNVFLTDPRLFGVRVTKNW
jgi:iron complex outermembrane receptor protein